MMLPVLAGTFRSFAEAAAPLAVAAAWQGLALFAALALCLRFAPRIPASQRFAIWLAAFAAIVALPFAPFLPNLFGPSAHPAAIAGAPARHALLNLDPRWTFAIAALWLAASLLRAADLAVHSLRLRRLWRAAEPLADRGTPPVRGAEICSTRDLDRPAVIGFLRPRILVPAWLLERMSAAELDQVVLHEAEHLRRGDDWTNLLAKLALVLFPLSPALWLADRRLGREREMACDEGVVRRTQAPRAYAACLASLAERGMAYRREALTLGAFARRPELVERVHSLLARRRVLSPAAAAALLTAVGAGLTGATVELARCPALVAFVAAAPVETAHIAMGAGDAVLPATPRRGDMRLHAVPAMAHLAGTRPMPAAHRAAKPGAGAPAIVPASPASQEAHLDLPAAPQPAAELVVFTSIERVDTGNGAAIADYDAGADAAAGAPQPGASRITVMQLFVKRPAAGSLTTSAPKAAIAPAAGGKTGAANAGAANGKPKFQPVQPAMVPFGDGWFVIQL